MAHLDYPFAFDSRGRTGAATTDDYIRDLIEQVVFTAPGERVNRPDFGSGIRGLVFEGNSDALAATVRASVEGALQMWLGELIRLEGVHVRNDDSVLAVTITYVILRTGERRSDRFASAGPA